MEYRRLGRTDLSVSVIGLGTGGRSKLGQKYGITQDEATRVVRRALDLGINHVDTAPSYDESETLLGNALVGVPRDSYVLATKMMPNQRGEWSRPEEFRESLGRSLKALRTEYLDVMYLHGVPQEVTDEVMKQFWPHMEQAKRDGLVRFLGVTERFAADHRHEMLQKVIPGGSVDVVMVGYNLLSTSAAGPVFELAQAHDVGVVIMCAVRGALLKPERVREIVGGWVERGLLPKDAVPTDDPLGWVLGPWADSISAAAYKFAAAHPAVSTVLTGTGSVAHLEENVRAILGAPLPPEIAQRAIDLFGPISHAVSY